MQSILESALKHLFIDIDINSIPKYFSDSYIAFASGKVYKGHKFIEKWAKQFDTAFTNRKINGIHILNQQENIVTWERSLQATQIKDKWGIKASHKPIKWSEMVVSRFENGLIKEERIVSELLGQLLKAYPKAK